MRQEEKTARALPIPERDPLHWAWNELSIRMLKVMIEELGVVDTLSSIKPRIVYSGRALVRNFASRFNLTEDLEMIASTPFCVRTLTWGGRGKSTITYYERGAVVHLFECPVSHGPPEMCIAYSHYVAEGACDEINPDYELVYTHHLIQGDPSCIGICRRKGEVGKDDKHLGKKLRTVTNFDIDDKERDVLSFNVEVHGIAIFVESFLSRSSPERVQQLLGPIFHEVGMEAGRRFVLKEKGSEEAVDPRGLLLTWGEMLGHQHELRQNEDGMELQISNCMCSSSQMLVCSLLESALDAMLSMVCPGIMFKFKKSEDASLEPCKISCLGRESQGKAHDDPMKVLKLRFARGEITEEEYLRKKELLLD